MTGKRFAWEAEQKAMKEADPETLLVEAEKQMVAARRLSAAATARSSFMAYVKYTSPDHEHPADVTKSKYEDAKHHRAVARVIEAIIKGEDKDDCRFLILTMPPRHGKSSSSPGACRRGIRALPASQRRRGDL
jgi:hypothetical protein